MRCIELQSNPQLSFALLEEFGTEMLTNCALVSLCSYIFRYTYVKGAVVHLVDVMLISEIKCPLEILFGRLSSICRGLVGEICALSCDDEPWRVCMLFVHLQASGTRILVQYLLREVSSLNIIYILI